MAAVSIAKLTRPRAAGAVSRERLFRWLDGARARPLAWVVGPPGAGKTTLAASYVRTRRVPCLWYDVDPGDADAATLFHYLRAAVRQARPQGRTQLPPLTPEVRGDLRVFSRRFFERLFAEHPGLLVLDSAHHAPLDSPFLEVLREGVAAVPAGSSVLVLSRTAPPAALARLRAHGLVGVLGGGALELSLAEARELVQLRLGRRARGISIRALHARTRGWAAGLCLLLEHARVHGDTGRADADQSVFDYLATELFSSFDPETQAVLLRIALAPRVTAASAAEVGENRRAPEILSALARRGCFVSEHGAEGQSYQLHPLLRAFLCARAEAALRPGALRRARRTAAMALVRDGQGEDALELLRQNGDGPGLAALLHEQAPALLAQGRSELLSRWIGQVPPRLRARFPWLHLWEGAARLPFAPAEARASFERALQALRRRRDDPGVWLGYAGVLESCSLGHEAERAVRWAALLDALERQHPVRLSPDLEARVASAVLVTLVWRRPDHPRLESWVTRAERLLGERIDPGARVLLGAQLLWYYVYFGNLARAGPLVVQLDEATRASGVAPLHRILALHGQSLYRWQAGECEAARQAVERALALARESGVHVWDAFLHAGAIYAALIDGDLRGAERRLPRMAAAIDPANPLERSHYHFVASWCALLMGELEKALEHARQSVADTATAGVPFPGAVSHLALAEILTELGRPREARASLAQVRGVARRTGSRVIHLLAHLGEARLLLASDPSRAREALAAGLGTARSLGYRRLAIWPVLPGTKARLLACALEAGIEPDSTRELIRGEGLEAFSPGPEVEGWPWRFRVYTLGRFAVHRGDAPLELTGKAQRRPVELLKVLIALGGERVPEARIGDALWPNADGDAAARSFAITLHRLRRLLGDPGLLVRKDWCLSLNQRLCWVDAWALEHRLSAAERNSLDPPELRMRLEQVLSLYQGPFLPEEGSAAWAFSARERIRSRVVRSVARVATQLQQSGRFTDARAWYQRGLELEPLAEDLHQGLMSCLGEMGYRAELVAAYRRCRSALRELAGADPSAKTVALARRWGLTDE